MIDFYNIEDRYIYQKNEKLKSKIYNGSFSRDWLLELTPNHLKELCNDKEHIISDNYRLRIHPYLRRFMSYGHAINFDLIECICYLGNNFPKLRIGIALDPKWITSKDALIPQIFELERAFGLTYDLTTIIQKLLKDHNSIKSAFFKPSGIGLKILINLKNDQNLVNFNIYEFSKNYCKDSVLNRSIHAYYNINSGFFIHIDGKALLFEKENYNPLKFIFNNIKRRHKRKLFRIDGDIPNKYFISLTTRFFFENELISEFFDGNSVEENIVNTLENIKA